MIPIKKHTELYCCLGSLAEQSCTCYSNEAITFSLHFSGIIYWSVSTTHSDSTIAKTTHATYNTSF